MEAYLEGCAIRFPHLGIEIDHLAKGVDVFGFTITYYGMIIAFGMIMGYLVCSFQAKRTGQDTEMYLDLALCDIICAVIGARIYYVAFQWEDYKDNLIQVFNLRGGGLAIYGGIIAGVLATYVFSKIRKVPFFLLLDTACAGLVTGQLIGRWGNFCNRECFGGYTDNLFAMQIRKSDVASGYLTEDIINHVLTVDGVEYIQVHPTFLYESLWNVAVLLVLLFFTKKKSYDGQIFLLYILGYGLGRLWIEGLRTDQLLLWNTNIPVSQAISAFMVVGALLTLLTQKFVRTKKK